jgi:hypothetical protein
MMRLLIVNFLFFIPILCSAKCVKGIYSTGISSDSLVFETSKGANNIQVASEYGLGAKLGTVVYCPSNQLEFTPYLRARLFKFKNSKTTDLSIDETNLILSTGLDVRMIKSKKYEWIGDSELRQEYYLVPRNNVLYNDSYLNLKLALGLRYTLTQDSRADYNIIFKYGALVPVSERDTVDMGQVYEIDLEYFKRMAKDYSIRADLYFSNYHQKISDLNTTRAELGLRINYIFRYL